MNGVEDCPVNCLSSLSLVKTLFAKSMASLRLFTLISSQVKSIWKGVLKIF